MRRYAAVTDQTLRAAAERQARAPEPPTLGQSRDAKLAEDVRPVGVAWVGRRRANEAASQSAVISAGVLASS